MKKSYIHNGFKVLIKKEANINFPLICIVCGKSCEDQLITISGTIDEYFGHWKRIFRGNPKLSFPVHNDCAIINRRNSRKRGILHTIILIFSAGTIYYINRAIDFWFWVFPFLLLYIIVRFILDRLWYKEPVLFSVDGDRYEFTFKNNEYAEAFESLNDKNLYEERLLKTFGANNNS
jgi:hypothetical protein